MREFVEGSVDPASKRCIVAVAARLPHIVRLHIEAWPGPGSRSHWAGAGTATVDARHGANGDWLFHESGRMRLDSGRNREAPGPRRPCSLAFRNVLRWRVDDSGIELAHQRFGADHEVALVRLVAAMEDDTVDMISVRPHPCGADRYHARLGLVGDGFDLHWRVEGPDKDDRLIHAYRAC